MLLSDLGVDFRTVQMTSAPAKILLDSAVQHVIHHENTGLVHVTTLVQTAVIIPWQCSVLVAGIISLRGDVYVLSVIIRYSSDTQAVAVLTDLAGDNSFVSYGVMFPSLCDLASQASAPSVPPVLLRWVDDALGGIQAAGAGSYNLQKLKLEMFINTSWTVYGGLVLFSGSFILSLVNPLG
jgi:hypothetical protein